MDTYQKLLELLEADMVIHKKIETVQERCVGAEHQIGGDVGKAGCWSLPKGIL